MPIRADGLNLEGFLPEPNINPNVQQRGVPTLAESLMMAAQPVTGRVEHFLNDPVQQANQSLLMGGPMAAVSGPMRSAIDAFKPAMQGKNSIFNPRIIKSSLDRSLDLNDMHKRTSSGARELTKRLDQLTPDEEIKFIAQLQEDGMTDTGIKDIVDVILSRKGANTNRGDFITMKQKKGLAEALLEAQVRKGAELNKDLNIIDSFQGFQKAKRAMGGPMAAINPVKAALGLKEYTRMKNILNLPRPMKNVPDSLLGFAKNPNNQKGFSDFNFKHNRKFRIKFDDGTEIVDEINGLNKPSAVERAIRNWSGAVDIEDLGQVK